MNSPQEYITMLVFILVLTLIARTIDNKIK